MKYLLLCFLIINFAQGQKFIPLDEETMEFIDQVNYTLYASKKPVFSSSTSKDSITNLPKQIVFDSISFNKLQYKEIGFRKDKLFEIIYLKKIVYELNEIIIPNSKPKEIVIGEKSRFIKKNSRALSKNSDYGLLFRENDLKNMVIKRMSIFFEKVKYKTTYKIKFYSASEIGNPIIRQHLELNELLFESPVLTLEKGAKNKIEINLEDYDINITNKDVFVCLELQDYYDENNTPFQPEIKDKTKLKFQLSNKINYYAKMYDVSSGIPSKFMNNINVMINYDFPSVTICFIRVICVLFQ